MKLNKNLVYISARFFAPPKPAAGGKGGPASAAPYVPVVVKKTPMQRLIEAGTEFPMGAPAGENMVTGVHRDHLVPKLESRIDVFAKKLRDYYLREGVLPEAKKYINTVRERQPEDTIEKLLPQKLVAGVIEGRDEFKDLDLVFPWSVPHLITRSDHYEVHPFYVKHEGDEIRVTLSKVDRHVKSNDPYFLSLQRYIVGRPNLLKMNLYPVQEDKSLHFQAGALFHFYVKELYVWCYTDTYPARIDVDCQDLSPSFSIKIGDIEKMLPHGMYLHKQYHHQRFRSVVGLTQTNLYMQRKNALQEANYAIQEQKKKMTSTLMNEKKKEIGGAVKKPSVKKIPTVALSAKYLMNEKKEAEKEAKAAEKKK